jgi:hypothetical protein
MPPVSKKKKRPGEEEKKTRAQKFIDMLKKGEGGIPKVTRERKKALEEINGSGPQSKLKKKKKRLKRALNV